jgi:DNA recombination protein RmuC
MDTALYILIGLVAGSLAGWLFAQSRISGKLQEYSSKLASSEAGLQSAGQKLAEKEIDSEKLKAEISDLRNRISEFTGSLATERASNVSLKEKLETQKKDLEEMGKKFNTEFENIANRILETKSEKFTKLNKENLNAILEPLGKNIEEFKKTVTDTYVTEAKERFSLGEKVKELAELNKKISEEANNLTRALKSDSKTQGGWGEMILETILEKSGLRKNEEYYMQVQLTDNEGKPLRSDSEDKKMRPDAIVVYPDDRAVIIDSKVSLNAFTRYLAATDPEEQKIELAAHIRAVKDRVDELNARGYDDYNKALDFVMMFIPSEPAYMAAMQGDPGLWIYSYEKRILLINPTNLITSLKLIVDLWKRERQNRNAQDIAERGRLLYDKFVGFVENLELVGDHLDKAKNAYNRSFEQLSTGDGNLVKQATELKNLGIKNKKKLNKELETKAMGNELPEQTGLTLDTE